MLLDILKQVLLCILLGVCCISAMARVDNWSQRRPNNTAVVGQNQWGQAGNRPAVGFQQPASQWNRYNQTQRPTYNNPRQQPQWQQQNNRTQFNYQPSTPQPNQNPWIRNNQTQYNPPQPNYPGQGSYGKSQGWGQPNNSSFNSHLYPSLPNNHQNIPVAPQANQNPWIRNNQTQYNPTQPNYPGQGSYGKSQGWGQPNNSSFNSHLYPTLRNNHQNIPQYYPPQPNYPANQTHFYPQTPNMPVQPNVPGSGSPLAPLQPQNSQGPQNWQSGGQSALSYGPGHYSQSGGNANNIPPIRQGSTNPYANMFN